MNAEEREDMKTIYEAAKQCQREPHIPKDPIVAEWINQFVKLYEHSEAQEKRIEELADIAAGNGKDADDLEDDLRIARTRIAELEEREKRRGGARRRWRLQGTVPGFIGFVIMACISADVNGDFR